MITVNVELPADLAAEFEPDRVSQEAAQLLALELFREERVSLGRAAELCRMPLAAFMDFVGRHGVSPLRYGRNELEEDSFALANLGL